MSERTHKIIVSRSKFLAICSCELSNGVKEILPSWSDVDPAVLVEAVAAVMDPEDNAQAMHISSAKICELEEAL